MKAIRIAVVTCGAAFVLSACSVGKDLEALVSRGRQGNEYRAVRNTPLVVPPGFDLRPPRGGGSANRRSRSTTVRARRTVIGGGGRAGASLPGVGERALVRKAGRGVRGSGGYVRGEVDKETKESKNRERTFTDKLLKWEKRKGGDVRRNPLGGKTDPVIKRKGEIF